MEKDNEDLKKLLDYVQEHWPSKLKEEWRVRPEEYAEIVKKVVAEITKGCTRGRGLVRVTGVSGSGKTTQLVPAAEAFMTKRGMKPVLIAGRVFVPYHPYCSEIVREYGKENLRKMTDDFATVMMFFVMKAVIKMGCDVIVDLALVSPEMEGMLIKMLMEGKYKSTMLMMVAGPEAVEKNLKGREWRHAEATEREFAQETERALGLYAKMMPEMRVVMWNTYDEKPIYDGAMAEVVVPCLENSQGDIEKLKQAKINYLTTALSGTPPKLEK